MASKSLGLFWSWDSWDKPNVSLCRYQRNILFTGSLLSPPSVTVWIKPLALMKTFTFPPSIHSHQICGDHIKTVVSKESAEQRRGWEKISMGEIFPHLRPFTCCLFIYSLIMNKTLCGSPWVCWVTRNLPSITQHLSTNYKIVAEQIMKQIFIIIVIFLCC